uniref:Uncharacterized protein n=2 Tax=Streptomyces TaxID=1883 RepID=A0A0A0V299_STRPT|nr:hypothetical protein [Streptomyces platensis]AIW55588.1 hypothetical protein [Streptomyces sp. CB00765]
MLSQILDRLRDPIVFALPAVGLLVAVEMLALRFGDDKDAKGFNARDTRASVLTGLGALVVSTLLRAAALGLYAVVYTYLAPFHLPADAWWTWVVLFFGVEFLLYWYHRSAHMIRIIWPAIKSTIPASTSTPRPRSGASGRSGSKNWSGFRCRCWACRRCWSSPCTPST